MPKNIDVNNIVWLDMEMTGLDPDVCHILEIACFVTDKNLNKISKIFHVVVNQPQNVLMEMNDWCMEHHSKSGLIKESQDSNINIKQAENQLLTFLKNYTPPGSCPLAGNSVYMDKLFLMKYLPRVANHLHYRLIDVSTIAELCKRWYPNTNAFKKVQRHRALPDIEESLAELKYFQKHFFHPKSTNTHDHMLNMIGGDKLRNVPLQPLLS